jgi:hypothetical protein
VVEGRHGVEEVSDHGGALPDRGLALGQRGHRVPDAHRDPPT